MIPRKVREILAGYDQEHLDFIAARLTKPGGHAVSYARYGPIIENLRDDGLIVTREHKSGRMTMRRTVQGQAAEMAVRSMREAEPLSEHGEKWLRKFGHQPQLPRFHPSTEAIVDGLKEAVEKGYYRRTEDAHVRTKLGALTYERMTTEREPPPPPEPVNPYAEMAMF